MPYCNPETNQVEELDIKSAKVTTKRVEKKGPVVVESPAAVVPDEEKKGPALAESPAAIVPDEEIPEESSQDVRAVPHPTLTALTRLYFAVSLNRALLLRCPNQNPKFHPRSRRPLANARRVEMGWSRTWARIMSPRTQITLPRIFNLASRTSLCGEGLHAGSAIRTGPNP